MSEAYLCSAAMTRFGRYPERSTAELGREAIRSLLAESGIPPDAIDAVYVGRAFAGALEPQITVAGQVALRGTGIEDLPVFNLDNACASAPSALHCASLAVRTGQYELALVVGMDKLYSENRRASMMALFGAMDVEAMAGLIAPEGEGNALANPFMDTHYATLARQYLEDTGAVPADLAKVSVKNRSHAHLNPYAQYRDPITEAQVLGEKMIASPLTRLMCSPLTDGAAAMLVCSERWRKHFDGPVARVAASVVRSGKPVRGDAPPVFTRAAAQAFEQASVDPGDIDCAELHDASAVAELVALEQIGFCAPGDGVKLIREGRLGLGGQLPVNTSGGLLSRGHPGAATGAAQLVELLWQIQGRCGERQVNGARIGLAHSSGGRIGEETACTAITILARD